MPLRVDVPADKDPLMYVWGEMVPGIGPAAAQFSGKVYEDTTLDLEAFEAARLRIAQINGCLFCQDWRTDFDGEGRRCGLLRRGRAVEGQPGAVRAHQAPPSTPSATPSTTTASTTSSSPA